MFCRLTSLIFPPALVISAILVALEIPANCQEANPSKAASLTLPKDPMDLLNACFVRSQKLEQFTQGFTKRERIEGKLGEMETIFLKFRAKPLSIYMKWIEEPHEGREVIYVEGKNENKAVLHEYVGPLNVLVKIDPQGPDAKKKSLRPVTQAGVRNATKSLWDLTQLGRQRGDMRLAYVGNEKLDGRDTYVLCRTMDKRDDYCAYVTLIYIEPQ